MGAGTRGAGTSTGDAARPGRDAHEAPERAAAAAAPVPEVSEVSEPTDVKQTDTTQAVLDAPDPVDAPDAASDEVKTDGADSADSAAGADDGTPEETSQRFSAVTRDTARPEGGGRAAPGDAAAPVRQWPLLSVLGTTGLGLLIVGLHPFAEAFRIGTILIGLALIGGAVLRRVLPSVGMLAVRSRFTDMVTYGLLGVVIVMLSLMTQPKPWLEIPFLEDIVHSTVP
ncbi:DUF3017 domain-containing protein [Streptomyces sp. NPDC059479]|uniref:DUF3017 domain-containing protein n=1 Tax=Streptomyces sp. NPDC059479 TaxID=3346848 RepID=UPI0036C70389